MQDEQPSAHTKSPATIGVVITIILVLVGAGLLLFLRLREKPLMPAKQPYSFEECIAAGNPIMESYPRQCRAGKYLFVETVLEQVSTGPVVFDNIDANQLVTSPLEVKAQAPGTWFFEANIGFRLLDADGKEVARGLAMADGEWMTEQLVPFTGKVTFTAPDTDTGYIEIEKDNSSDLPEHDASVRIPIRFR